MSRVLLPALLCLALPAVAGRRFGLAGHLPGHQPDRPPDQQPRPTMPASSAGDEGEPSAATAYAAVAALTAEQLRQLAAHAHLDEAATWRQPPAQLLAHLESQLAEIRALLPDRADLPPLLPGQAARLQATCANAANYLAFLAVQARPEPANP